RHALRIAMTRDTVGTRDQFHRPRSFMFPVTRRTRSILNNVGFMKRMLFVASAALLVDRLEGNAVPEPFLHNRGKRPAGHGGPVAESIFMAGLAFVRDCSVRARD